MFKSIFQWLKGHKLYSVIILIILVGGGYWGWQKWFVGKDAVRYITAKVERGALTTSISGTGQVAVIDQLDLKAKASGDVIFVGAKVGDEVKSGATLLQINASDALKTVRDAEANLESAKLSLVKMQQPADTLSLLQAENSLEQAQESEKTYDDSLNKSYEDGYNAITNAFLDLPTLMTGMNSILYGNDFENSVSNIDWYANQATAYCGDEDSYKILNYREKTNSTYSIALKSFNTNFDNYKSTSRISSTSTIEKLTIDTYETAKLIADAVKNANNYIDFTKNCMQTYSNRVNIPATLTTHQTSLISYTGKTNTHLSTLLSITSSFESAKNNIVNSTRSIAEKIESLVKLKAGTDPLDIQAQEMTIKQRENSLQDARENLADYSVRAPFAGVLATFTVKKGDAVSSGSSFGTLITKQYMVSIALNEVDIAKVKLQQKAVLTFDAIDSLNITGEVVEIDSLGTVSQGVVSYNVKIAFDMQDDRIKSGMSVSANIILSSKLDVLMIASGVVKTQNGVSYVEVLDANGQPTKKDVQVGESNDSQIEIVSGLSEGEEVITQKITATAGGTVTTQSSGGNNRQSGGVRIPGMF